jgi:hypothetical protein
MRIRAPRGFPRFFTSAFGTKIMALHPSASGDMLGGVPTIDVQDQTISFETPPNGPLFPLYIPVSDDKLFALDFGTFEILRKPEPSPSEPSGMWISHVSSYGVQPDGCIIGFTCLH